MWNFANQIMEEIHFEVIGSCPQASTITSWSRMRCLSSRSRPIRGSTNQAQRPPTIFPSTENALLESLLKITSGSIDQAQRLQWSSHWPRACYFSSRLRQLVDLADQGRKASTIFPLTKNMLLPPSFETSNEFEESSTKALMIIPSIENTFL